MKVDYTRATTIRVFKRENWVELKNPLVILDRDNESLAVIIPYAMFLRLQKLIDNDLHPNL